MKFSIVFAATALISGALARPSYWRREVNSSVLLANGEEAIALNEQFATLTVNSSCTSGTDACVNGEFAQCVDGAYVLQSCGSNLTCAALPLVNSAGTSITCATEEDVETRIAATGASNTTSSSAVVSSTAAAASTAVASSSAATTAVSATSVVAVAVTSASVSSTASAAIASSTDSTDAAQNSTTLLSSLLNTAFEQNGTDFTSSEPDELPSITSFNNFINFCATVDLPLTNGSQITNGSCNAAPMGVIASTSNMPSGKFVYPPNLGTVAANTTFNLTLAIERLQTGWFVNPDTNYFAAPQQVNSTTGDILGHSHVVIEQLSALNQTTPTDPTSFVFFKGLNDVAVDGTLTAEVTDGLPAGFYRMASINAAANHQPVLVAVAQHGSLDDMVYFTVE